MPCPILLGGITFDGSLDVNGFGFDWTQPLEGWAGPAVELATSPRQSQPGVFIGEKQYRARELILAGFAVVPPPFDSNYDEAVSMLGRAMALGIGTAPGVLVMQTAVVPKQATVHLNGRIRARPRAGLARMVFEVPLLAPDPRKYSVAEVVQVGVDGAEVATNNGNIRTPFVLSVAGPAVDPSVQVTTDANKIIHANVTVPVGQTLTIDTAERKVRLNGVTQFGVTENADRWPEFLPGMNNLIVDDGGGVATLRHRHAYAP